MLVMIQKTLNIVPAGDLDNLSGVGFQSDSQSDSDSTWFTHAHSSWASPSDSEHDSNLEGSLNSEEELEVMDNAMYLQRVHNGPIPTSSTLTILAVYWTLFKPLCIHELLPLLPCLEELCITQFPSLGDIYKEPLATVLFPQLLFLHTSHENTQKLSLFALEITRIALNLTHLWFTSH